MYVSEGITDAQTSTRASRDDRKIRQGKKRAIKVIVLALAKARAEEGIVVNVLKT